MENQDRALHLVALIVPGGCESSCGTLAETMKDKQNQKKERFINVHRKKVEKKLQYVFLSHG